MRYFSWRRALPVVCGRGRGETAFSHSSRSRTPLKARALFFVCANDVCIRPAGAYVIPPPAMGTMIVPFCEMY